VTSMQRWLDAVCADLGIDPGLADARTILDLAREVAHRVDRPAAPLTARTSGLVRRPQTASCCNSPVWLAGAAGPPCQRPTA